MVSVIVAGKDEADYIEKCLESIISCDYPQDRFEVVFVDDHSSDQTLDVARRVADNSLVTLRVLSAPDEPVEIGSKKRALNHAIQTAKGEILLFTDADDRVKPGWIRTMVSCFESNTGAVLGAAIPIRGQGIGSILYRLERAMVALTSMSQVGWGFPGTACGQNLALRKEAFERVGGYAFAKVPSGDDDLTVQAVARDGWRVRFSSSPESVVADYRRPSVTAHSNATTRHQSVTKFYPIRWRLLYLMSILSSLLLLAWACSGIFSGILSLLFVYAFGAKVLLDTVSLLIFSQILSIQISFFELVAAHLILPFFSLIRPLYALRSGYHWRNSFVTDSAGRLSQHPSS